ncbi:winged helix-turn-helix domain-containing protein [Falsiroseomonas oryzae]|uniref:winged helix-turn-helix domain-containing protein n=1 Tax=Falsiroseomonas oryzae TaxID=2766473 RepID=UPI0022EAF7F4|nr:winged helix-turn-helix domain-containing protein [Roseomonas sp. MO-31]
MFDGIPQPPTTLPCGAFRLDLAARRLLDPAGRPVRLRSKSFDVLHTLLRHTGRVVGREELLDAVWGAVHVTDDSVTQCIGEIRRALGTRPGVVLRTVAGHGYMLELPMAAPEASPALAVAPFTALGPEAAPVGEALRRDLLVTLAGLGGIRVLALPPAATQDAAALLVEGSVLHAGSRLRITAQLVDAASALVVWAQRFEAGPEACDLIAVQDEVAAHVSAEVRRTLRPG